MDFPCPCGDVSFADVVVSYEPDFSGGPVPEQKWHDPTRATGVPDHMVAGLSNVSLSIGGRITLQFFDNYLTGSSDDKLDLWIFEIEGSVKETYVEISKDGDNWYSVEKALDSTSGVDIDLYSFGNGDFFSFVRLTDDSDQGVQTGPTVGADVDAVGASSCIQILNNFMIFEQDPSTYTFTEDTAGCPESFTGKFSFDATLTNISENLLTNLGVECAELTNDNLLLTNHGLLGEGDWFPITKTDDYVDGVLSLDEYVDVPFTVCCKRRERFRFFVDVIGIASD